MHKIGIRGNALQINRNRTQGRSSSNLDFNEKIRTGLKTGADLSNAATRNILKPIPGSAVLSSSLSSAAASLGGPSSLGGIGGINSVAGALGGTGVDGDLGSLQDELVKNNAQLIERQVEVSQITTNYTARSNLIRSLFEALKSIVGNFRA